MNYPENIASDFLEFASEQRLYIILKLAEKRSSVSVIAKELDATVPEVYRNFERLAKAELITKDTDGNYHLTTYGKTICDQIPSLIFVSKNKTYFKNHDFGDLPIKFIQRIGSLGSGEQIKGFVKVLEQVKEIYGNANEYLCNILYEVPYTSDFIELLIEKLKKGTKVRSIFSESAIITKERKKTLDKVDFKKFIDKDLLQRKMKKDVKIIVVLNEKEACVVFPKSDGEVDMSEIFYSSESLFHEWCLDYFEHCWQNSNTFQENKLKQ